MIKHILIIVNKSYIKYILYFISKKNKNMSELYDKSNLNKMPFSFLNSEESSNSSKEIQKEFYMNYHFLCKKCEHVPIMEFSKKGKIRYSSCRCKKKYKNISIDEIYEYLYKIDESKEEESGTKNLKCFLHEEKFSFYCKTLKRDYCLKCENENCSGHHNSHIEFGNNDRYIKEYLDYIKKQINNQNDIKTNKIKVKEVNNFINIENNINNDIENLNKIYPDILTIKNQSDFEIYEDEHNYINLFKIIINDYENYPNYNLLKTIKNLERFATSFFDDINMIDLIYEFSCKNITNDSKITLFGSEFVDKNKENCFLIVNENFIKLAKEYKLKDFFDEIPLFQPFHLKVNLVERKRKKMSNLSYMFKNVSSIHYKSELGNYNTSNIKEMDYIFYNCKSEQLPDISNWNTKNVIDMSYLFYNCSSVKKLPNISNWDTSKVENMSYMFSNCCSIKKLPNISNWNTENVRYFNNMFENCSLISSFPDLSKWNVKKARDMKYVFKNCSSLVKFPNISTWIIDDDTATDGMFEGDISLEYPSEFIYKDINIIQYFVTFIYFVFYIFVILVVLFAICYLIYTILQTLIYLYYYYIGFYISYSFNNIEKIINNPIEYFELKNKNQFIKKSNITNSSYVQEIMNNKIKIILNFTRINENTEFKSDENLFKNYSILSRILGAIRIFIYIFTCFNIKQDLIYLDYSKTLYLLILAFLNNLVSLIIEILENTIVEKLLISIKLYFITAEKFMRQKCPIDKSKELNFLESCLIPTYFNIFFFLIHNILTFGFVKFIYKIRNP